MKQLLKKIVSFTLAIACVITMLPTSAYAEFNTDSTVASGSGKKYNTLTNIVNVGYRISLYYTGKDDTTGKKYMPNIAYNSTGNPLMLKYSSLLSTESYTASKNLDIKKVSATYFRDLAAKKSSILVLNSTGDKFGTIYQLKPTTDYKNTKMTWDEVDDKRICKKDSSNAVYKWINKYTNNALSKFQSKSWLGTRNGASAIVDSTALDGIDKEFSKRKLTAKRELVKAFKPYTDTDYYTKCLADLSNVYIQIEPVAIFSSKDFGYDKGFMATWSEVRWACNKADRKHKATERGCFSWRTKPNNDLEKSLVKEVNKKVLKSKNPKDVSLTVNYYTKSYDNSTNRSCAAASILGTLYNTTVWNKSTKLTSGYNTCSGIAYYGCSDTPDKLPYENVESISLLYTGKLNESSMNIEDGKWSQANALAVLDTRRGNNVYQVMGRVNPIYRATINGTQDAQTSMALTEYIDYANAQITKKYGKMYTYTKGTNYEDKKVTKARGTVGYSTKSMTDGYNLVAYYNYLINNKKATVKNKDVAKNYDKAVRDLVKNDGKGLQASWQRSTVGNGSEGLNAGYTVNFKGIKYNDGKTKYTNMFNIVENKVVKSAYKGLKSSYGIARVLEYPYYATPSSDNYTITAVNENQSDNILASGNEKKAYVLTRKSVYAANIGKSITDNVLILGNKNSLATQAYYLEGTCYKGLLGSSTTTMSELNKINANRKYALNVLVAAKIADATSYYTWSTYDFSKNNFASHGNTSKTYDITSNGLFPLGENGQKGIKRVIIVPNTDNDKMAISQNELDSIVSRACQSADESQSEKTILASIWRDLRATLEEKANSKAYTGSVRDHYNNLLDQYSDADMFKHNGSETAAVGFYQDDNVENDVDNSSETINDEGIDYKEDEVDESAEAEEEKDMASDKEENKSGTDEAEDASVLAQFDIKMSEKDFISKMNEFFKSKGVTQVVYDGKNDLVTWKIGTELKDADLLFASLASNAVNTFKGTEYVNVFDTDNPLTELAKLFDSSYKEPTDSNEEEDDYYGEGEEITDSDNKDVGIKDDGEDIEDTIGKQDKSSQRGYTIIGVGYTGKRTKTQGIDLQSWELNYVYADLQAALQASNRNKISDKDIGYVTSGYASTHSDDSRNDLHSNAYLWSYTGNHDHCADGHTSKTEETHNQPHAKMSSYAKVSYVPSAAAWDKDDDLFTYNVIVSDETRERNASVDTIENSNYTYTVNKNKLHADEDDDETQNRYSLVLWSDEIMHDMWDNTNLNRGYNNTAVKWNTWSRISKNFNHAKDYKTHYFTVNTMREAAYFSYVYNLIRYISGDEKVASSIYNYNAIENQNKDLKGDKAIIDFVRDCLLMKTDNVPNLKIAHLSQSSDVAQKRNRKAKFNVPYYSGDGNARNYISEHIVLNAYMQDDNDNISQDSNGGVDITYYNKYGQNGEIYHTFSPSNMSHSSSDAKKTIEWKQTVATTLNIIDHEHCDDHKVTGYYWYCPGHSSGRYSWSCWGCCLAPYTTDLPDVPAVCFHNRTIRGVMPAVFAIRTVDIDTGKLGEEESSDSYNLDYGETIYKYITESMEMGENNQKTGVIDTNGDMINPDATVDTKMNDSIGHEAVSSEKAQGGNSESNSKIETNFHTAFFDAQSTDKMNKTAFGFYPEVNMLAYEYGRGQKLSGYKGVTPYVVPVMGEIARSAKGANLYFMTTKQNSYKGFVSKNGSEDTTLNQSQNDFSGSTLSDSVASGTQADALQKAQATSSCNTDKSKEQVIYAGSDVTVTGDSNFSLNLYGYSLDLINKDDVITKSLDTTEEYTTYTDAYTDVVADNSNIYQKWYEVINGTYKDIIAAVKADSPIRTADSNRDIMNARYNEWSKEVTKIDNWTADYTLNVHGNGYNSKFTNFSATIGTLKTAQGKEATTSQTDVYSLHIKNGDIIKTDGSYVAMINQIAMDYFGDEATDVSGTVTLTNGVQVAKLKHYDAAQELFEKSDIGSSVKNAIESSSDDFNKSGSCFSDGDSRGVSSIGSVKNWYDEEVRTIVVRRFKTEPLYFKGITASDKIDYNIAPDADTMTEDWKGRQADWYLNLYYKADKVDEFGTTASTLISGANRKFQVIRELYVDNASFIVPSATTDNMGW